MLNSAAGRDVGDVVAAAHDDHLGHMVDQLREEGERRGDVGERPDRDQGDLVGGVAVGLDQELDGVGACALERARASGISTKCTPGSRSARGIGKSRRAIGRLSPA